jgi:hypothetical protein
VTDVPAVAEDVVTVAAVAGVTYLGSGPADPTLAVLAVAGLGGYRMRRGGGGGEQAAAE